MSENSATCANWSPLLPLPCPVLRPPLASANSVTEQRKRKKQQEEMINSREDDQFEEEHIFGGEDEAVQKAEEEKEREIEHGTAPTAAEQRRALNGGEKAKKEMARQNDKVEKMKQSRGKKAATCPSADFRLRRPIERIRQLLAKRPMLLQLLNPAFKRFVKRTFRARPSVPLNARVPPPRRALRRPPRRPTAFTSAQNTATAKRRLIAIRICRRCVRFAPLSRLPPFQCPKCVLLTRRPQTMLNHICVKKPIEFKNVNQIVELGFRSRVKDAMSVLERIPNPQAKQFRRYCEPMLSDNDYFSLHQPLRLSEIALKYLQKLNVVKIVQTQQMSLCQLMPYHSLTDTTKQHIPKATVSSNQRDAICSTSTGFFCTFCARLFARYADWDAHLCDENGEEEDTAGSCSSSDGRNPMPIECQPNDFIPRNGFPIEGTSSPLADESAKGTEQRRWRCSACALQQFTTRAEFHAHLLKCALASTMF